MGYKKALCAFPLHLTSGSGFANEMDGWIGGWVCVCVCVCTCVCMYICMYMYNMEVRSTGRVIWRRCVPFRYP